MGHRNLLSTFMIVSVLSLIIMTDKTTSAADEVDPGSRIRIDQESYIGPLDSVHAKLIDSDVHQSEIAIYKGTAYILYAQYNRGRPKIFARTYSLSDHVLSPRHHIATYDSRDHFPVSVDIDEDGYAHLVYGGFMRQESYRRTTNPEDITDWTDEELFCDTDATYQSVRTHGDTIYNLYRDG